MAKNLVIVESPAKAKTLAKYLGRDYQVKASVGHVMDLPKSKLGVDIENDFAARVPRHPGQDGRSSTSSRRRRRTRRTSTWPPTPIARARPSPGTSPRSSATQEEERPPRPLQRDHQEGRPGGDQAAARARPPSLRRAAGAARARPAGRLPALPAPLEQGAPRPLGRARAVGRGPPHQRARARDPRLRPGGVLDDRRRGSKAARRRRSRRASPRSTARSSTTRSFRLDNEARGRRGAGRPARARRGPSPRSSEGAPPPSRRRRSSPRACSRRRRASSASSRRRTMRIAQRLYEGVELGERGRGRSHHLHAHRLDAALAATPSRRCASYIGEPLRRRLRPREAERLPLEEGRAGRARGDPADRHRVRRPSAWRRSSSRTSSRSTRSSGTASSPARWRRRVSTRPPSTSRPATCRFRATGQVVKFDGFIRVYTEGRDDGSRRQRGRRRRGAAAAADGGRARARCASSSPEQHFTQPPPRFTQATLIKELEENGIGRPSTYARSWRRSSTRSTSRGRAAPALARPSSACS